MLHGNLSNISSSYLIGIRLEDTVIDIVENKRDETFNVSSPHTDAITICAEISRKHDMDYRFILSKKYKHLVPDIAEILDNAAVGIYFESVFLVDNMNEIAVYVANGTFRYYIDNDYQRRQKVHANAVYSTKDFKQILFRR